MVKKTSFRAELLFKTAIPYEKVAEVTSFGLKVWKPDKVVTLGMTARLKEWILKLRVETFD